MGGNRMNGYNQKLKLEGTAWDLDLPENQEKDIEYSN